VPGKAGPAGTHRGGATMVWWGHLRTAVFRWRGGSGDFQWPRGGDPAIRDGGERGGCRWRSRSEKEAGAREKRAKMGAAPFLRGVVGRQRRGSER
jgi:hypothetical protein